MIPFCDCTSGGLQLRVIDSAVVASTVKLTGGMLGAAARDCKELHKCQTLIENIFISLTMRKVSKYKADYLLSPLRT